MATVATSPRHSFHAVPDAGVIPWDDGRRITLTGGQSARCTKLVPGQIYAAILYNGAQNQQATTVQILVGNQFDAPVVVPGTTANEGLASVALFTGSDSTTVEAVLLAAAGSPKVEAWLGSVSMPTNTAGIVNRELPADGKFYEFGKATRYFSVPASRRHFVTIRSVITQFISLQFREEHAQVNVVNAGPNPLRNIVPVGTVRSGIDYNVNSTTSTFTTYSIFGDGSQWVWMSADSQQNANTAEISLQG
ncbi:MAG TPA: hypothetical protein VKZ53_16240 [Candidatus Angelobacter sp.]|nr:hypothetical protein [Candidatus Angelobacter sp.]